MTPVRVLSRWLNAATGRSEVFEAESLDGRWHYERTEHDGTPWIVTYLPTGQVEWLSSLPAARRVTADPRTVALLRQRAQDVVDRGGRLGEVRYPLDEAGRPYRYEVPEDPVACAQRAEQAQRIIALHDQHDQGAPATAGARR